MWVLILDPTETALVRLGESYGFDEAEARGKYPRLAELPFDSDRKLMSTVHQLPDGLTMLTKGAVDVMLGRTRLSPEEKAEIERMNEELSQQGLRVLAFGKRMLTAPAIGLEDENDLQFLGLIAMMDPPREESKAAVAECIRAGIRPIMITGDHKITAAAIAREIGILRDGTEAVEGAVIDGMRDEELQDFVPKVSVYARVSPEHKIRIVRAWQQRGNLVAMTGDGVNDAPALKQADIGVAMGITGTEVAKDAAGMVLADDNFSTIVAAVREGRVIFDNIRKFLRYLLSSNVGEVFTVFGGVMLAGVLGITQPGTTGVAVPLLATQLLWINLLTDAAPALAMGVDPQTDDVMARSPRKLTDRVIDRDMWIDIAFIGIIMAAVTLIGMDR